MIKNATHRVHGTDGSEVAGDWQPLQHDEVAALLRHYPQTGLLERICWRSPRPLSAAAVVETSRGRLFIKRHHHSVRTPATLAEEHVFMAHLRAHGLAVPQVLPDARGHTARSSGEWTFEVHECIAGRDIYRELVSWQPVTNLAHAREAGRMLARLHAASAGFAAPQRTTHILVTRDDLLRSADLVAALEQHMAARPALADALAQRPWRQAIEEIIVPRHAMVQPRLATQPRLWCHNDWHASNLAWSDAGTKARITTVFDFGLSSPTFALFDLATAIERNAVAWLELPQGTDIGHPTTAQALVAGYREVRPLDQDQLDLLADLLPVVHLDFALSELEYFHAITNSRRDADAAWQAFLIGHARWFDTDEGKALQQALQQP